MADYTIGTVCPSITIFRYCNAQNSHYWHNRNRRYQETKLTSVHQSYLQGALSRRFSFQE